MKTSHVAVGVAGVLVGVALARHLMVRSSCCAIVADGVEERIVAAAGGGPAARALGTLLDRSGITAVIAGLL